MKSNIFSSRRLSFHKEKKKAEGATATSDNEETATTTTSSETTTLSSGKNRTALPRLAMGNAIKEQQQQPQPIGPPSNSETSRTNSNSSRESQRDALPSVTCACHLPSLTSSASASVGMLSPEDQSLSSRPASKIVTDIERSDQPHTVQPTPLPSHILDYSKTWVPNQLYLDYDNGVLFKNSQSFWGVSQCFVCDAELGPEALARGELHDSVEMTGTKSRQGDLIPVYRQIFRCARCVSKSPGKDALVVISSQCRERYFSPLTQSL
jgi:hypothetical protein